MLFHSTIRKELARSFGATLVVLVTVIMTMMLIRTLGQASKGTVNPSDVMMVMGYTLLGQLPTILGLCLFVAIVATLSRMYGDSEMVIWFSSGKGLASFLAPMARFAWPVLLVIALLSIFVWPWSNQQIQDMKDRFERRSDIDRIAPGEFQESANGSRVFFIDRDTSDNRSGSNVFVSASERGREAVTSARSAELDVIKDERFVILHNGQRLENTKDKPGLKVSEFEEYATRVGSVRAGDPDAVPPRSRSTAELLRNPSNLHQGELSWRIGLALAACNFVLMALAVASVNPRAGRSSNLAFALFAFVVYYNLLNLGQSWVGSGRFHMGAFLVSLHGGVLLFSLLLLAKRHNNWNWSFWRRTPKAAP
jgi:lipopolysaccharide export system permease protein